MKDAPIYFEDATNITISEIRAKCRKLKIEKDNSYGLTDGTELKIKYFFRDSKEKNLEEKEIIFGKTDFSQSSRYFMNGKNLNVYEVDSSLEKYLTFSEQLWYEPYIVSKETLNNISYKDIQRIKVIYDNKTKVYAKTVSDNGP